MVGEKKLLIELPFTEIPFGIGPKYRGFSTSSKFLESIYAMSKARVVALVPKKLVPIPKLRTSTGVNGKGTGVFNEGTRMFGDR